MGKVVPFSDKQPVYQVDHCAGCKQRVRKDYHEITMPGPTYIALCDSCFEDAVKEGIFKG